MSAFACLSPLKEFQCFLWCPIVQFLTAFFATPVVMPQAGSGLMNEHSDPSFAN
jgi:hypothetical protein